MKKLLFFIPALALALCASSASVFAAGPARSNDAAPTAVTASCLSGHSSCAFTDEDGDGICDNRAGHGAHHSSGHGRAFCRR